MTFENDYTDAGIIRMHMPSSMFENLADMLRNESTITVYFAAGKGFLGTGVEPVGEGE